MFSFDFYSEEEARMKISSVVPEQPPVPEEPLVPGEPLVQD